ncbi:oxidoreductase molybdopterin binding domain-containing protein [Phellopilus nigrolimitatus]|nr:oxidoreductase molybdopterin binding domain-containing protein [Phellopilus nigrolimitatus]
MRRAVTSSCKGTSRITCTICASGSTGASIWDHGGVPNIDEDALCYEVGGLVNSISLKDLKVPEEFLQGEKTVTLQCSGVRHIEQILEYPSDGDELTNTPWGESTIGTAVHEGVPLKKVLNIACDGVHPDRKHLKLIGADIYFKPRKGQVLDYAAAAPWRKVRTNEEVLLAYETNRKPLPKIHGAPLHAVPSMGPVQRQEHPYFTQQIGKQNTKYSNGFSSQSMSVLSMIIHLTDFAFEWASTKTSLMQQYTCISRLWNLVRRKLLG